MKAKAFTLVELLVTISIIGLLAGLSIPAIKAARETAEVGGCMSNIRQLTTAILATAADNNGQIFAGEGSTNGWATFVGSGDTVTNGNLWSGGYVKDTKLFLCPHGRKSDPRWYGSPACHYSFNVTPEISLGSGIIVLNRIPNSSKAILLFEEDVNIASKSSIPDSRAALLTNLPPGQGDNRLYTERNHRKKGCVSYYDGSAASMSGAEWTNMLNTANKRRVAFGVQ